MAKQEKDLRLDLAKLSKLQEPLTVRVEKLKGNIRQPIELPSKDGAPPGTNWVRDEILTLENRLLTDWSGGGHYRASVVDAAGLEMSWEWLYDPRLYPEKVPPNTASATNYPQNGAAMSNPAQPTIPTNVQPLGAAAANATPQAWGAAYAQNYTPPQSAGPALPLMQPGQAVYAQPQQQWTQQPMQPQQPWGMTPPAPWGWNQQPSYAAPWGQPVFQPPYQQQQPLTAPHHDDDSRGRRDRELHAERERDRREWESKQKQLEAQLREAQLNQKEIEYKATLDRIQQNSTQQIQQLQQQHANQMTTLQEELRRIADTKGKGEDEDVRRLREEQQRQRELAQAEQAALQKQLMDQQLAAMRQASEAQVTALREQLVRMNEKPHGESDEVRQIRMEQERLRQDAERQRQETERRLETERAERAREQERHVQERRDSELKQNMREQREAFERQVAQLQAEKNRGPDPIIDMIKETSRMQAEQNREIARMQQESTTRLTSYIVPPAQLVQMMKEGSSGNDQLMRNVVESVGGIVNMYKTAAENAMQLSGGGSDPPAARLIEQGLNGARELVGGYLEAKRDTALAENKTKLAQAQAQAVQAQAYMRANGAVPANGGRPTPQWAAPPPVAGNAMPTGMQGAQARMNGSVPTGVVNGPHVAPMPQPPMPQVMPTEAMDGLNGADGTYGDAPPMRATKKGPTEEEVFGQALSSVKRLRKGVAEGALDPTQAVAAILQGVEAVAKANLDIPAFVLFQDERYPDFVDVLLPDASSTFRAECTRILLEEIHE